MAENAVADAIAKILDWREVPHMAHSNCLALKICAIIQVISISKTLLVIIAPFLK